MRATVTEAATAARVALGERVSDGCAARDDSAREGETDGEGEGEGEGSGEGGMTVGDGDGDAEWDGRDGERDAESEREAEGDCAGERDGVGVGGSANTTDGSKLPGPATSERVWFGDRYVI